MYPKITWNHKRLQITKTILGTKINAGQITIPDLNIYYRATVIKAIWYCYKNQYVDI